MKRRDFIKALPFLPVVIGSFAAAIMSEAEAKGIGCRHEPLFKPLSPYYSRLHFSDDETGRDIEICKHCGLLYGVEIKE